MINTEQLEILKSIYSIDVPDLFLDRVRILVRDVVELEGSDKFAYNFTSPLECPFYPGYYYIPRFTKYVINREGVLRNVKTGFVIKWSTASKCKPSVRGGYKTTNVKSDRGFRQGLFRHRALVLVFKEYQQHPDEFLVNHKNGIGGSDELDNLEICSAGENIQHAYDLGLYSNRVVEIDAHNWVTNEYYSFDRITKCVAELSKIDPGLTFNLVSIRLKVGSSKRHKDGWRFKRRLDNWSTLDEYTDHSAWEKEVICRNVITNVVCIFRSIAETARELNMVAGTIKGHCESKAQLPVHCYQFRYLSDFKEWPKYTEHQIAIFKEFPVKPGNGIEVYDISTNQTLFFTSPIHAGKHFNIAYSTASSLALYNGTKANRYKFKLVRIRENY